MEGVLHQASYQLMDRLITEYVPMRGAVRVLDVGSRDVNGTYRPLIEGRGWSYTGLDIVAGPNVDVVKAEYAWGVAREYELVISGNCLEHVGNPFRWMGCVVAAVDHGGIVIVVTPSQIHEHREPVDCWRVMPDGMEVLMEHFGLTMLSVGRLPEGCRDTWGVARRVG